MLPLKRGLYSQIYKWYGVLELSLYTINFDRCYVYYFNGMKSLLHAAVIQKMAEQMSQQAMKLTFLQKKVDNVSLATEDMRNAYLSLEGKIGEDKGKEFQPLLKGKRKMKIIHWRVLLPLWIFTLN